MVLQATRVLLSYLYCVHETVFIWNTFDCQPLSRYGECTSVAGGKPDDITVVIATVNSGELGEFIS